MCCRPAVTSTWWAAVVVILVAASGCGNGGPKLPASYHGTAVPVATSDYVEPIPETDLIKLGPFATIDDHVLFKMEADLLPEIRQQVKLSMTCNSPLGADGTNTVRCQVAWDGVEVPFDVTTTHSPGSIYAQLNEVKQLQGLLTRDAVRDAWSHYPPATALSCDSSLPEAVLVPLDQPTKYHCADGHYLYTVEIVSSDGSDVNGDITFIQL